MLTTRRAAGFGEQRGPTRKRKWEQRGPVSSGVQRVVATAAGDSWARLRQRWLQREEDEEGATGGDCDSKRGWLQPSPSAAAAREEKEAAGGPTRAAVAGSDEEAREEGEGSGGPVRVVAMGEGGGCGVNVRSAQRWLRLRAREATALAGSWSRGERGGLCMGGATTEEDVAAAVVEEGRAATMCGCCGRRGGEEEAEEAAVGTNGRQVGAEVD
ncbi:hypothetical protein B296_00034261 [Ensete ventricosum]|uniref:DUF834 domain-containing protein n=1 Tax=Ensete ventricosum TaxID=4639 RepID=A0A426XEG5_ENSVE|nr:hypothetical protein B296_00034261 [Ensete ventricosum]